MKRPPRRALIVCAVALAGLGLRASHGWAAELGLDFWNVPDLFRQLDRERDQCRAIDAEMSEIQTRCALREEWVDDLLAGRLTEQEVADNFLALNRAGDHMEEFRRGFPGRTDLEKAHQQVRYFVAVRRHFRSGTRPIPESEHEAFPPR